MSLPIDRNAKADLDANLVNGNTSDAPVIKANNDVVYNTIDELNGVVTTLGTTLNSIITGVIPGTSVASSDAVPEVLMIRDAQGRARVADPSNSGDITTKNYVDRKSVGSIIYASQTLGGF